MGVRASVGVRAHDNMDPAVLSTPQGESDQRGVNSPGHGFCFLCFVCLKACVSQMI